MKPPLDRVPFLAAWTEDVAGIERRFTPFAHGTAPAPDQAGTRAVNAAAAREAVDIVGTPARRLALPLGALVALGVTAILSRLAGPAASPAAAALAPATGYLAGLAAYMLVRRITLWRHRGYAARAALQVLGLCGTCGFPLRGAITRVDGRSGEPVELCQCAECGSLWPAMAMEHPKRSDTGERVDFPHVEGLDAARTRMRLWRALRAQPGDFVSDATGEPRYIAHMDGVHRSGALAFARDLFDSAAAFIMCIAVGALMLGCCGSFTSLLVRAIFQADPNDAAMRALGEGLEVALSLALVIGAVRWTSGVLTPRHRILQSRRFLRAGECPCCTMTLPPPDAEGIARCTCCTAAWSGAATHDA